MQVASSMDVENGKMVVKRVSVPIGLEELMENLTKEVIVKKPKDIYLFASDYFAELLMMREKECKNKETNNNKIDETNEKDIKNKVAINNERNLYKNDALKVTKVKQQPRSKRSIQKIEKPVENKKETRINKPKVDSITPAKPVEKKPIKRTSIVSRESSSSRKSTETSSREVSSREMSSRDNSTSRFRRTTSLQSKIIKDEENSTNNEKKPAKKRPYLSRDSKRFSSRNRSMSNQRITASSEETDNQTSNDANQKKKLKKFNSHSSLSSSGSNDTKQKQHSPGSDTKKTSESQDIKKEAIGAAIAKGIQITSLDKASENEDVTVEKNKASVENKKEKTKDGTLGPSDQPTFNGVGEDKIQAEIVDKVDNKSDGIKQGSDELNVDDFKEKALQVEQTKATNVILENNVKVEEEIDKKIGLIDQQKTEETNNINTDRDDGPISQEETMEEINQSVKEDSMSQNETNKELNKNDETQSETVKIDDNQKQSTEHEENAASTKTTKVEENTEKDESENSQKDSTILQHKDGNSDRATDEVGEAKSKEIVVETEASSESSSKNISTKEELDKSKDQTLNIEEEADSQRKLNLDKLEDVKNKESMIGSDEAKLDIKENFDNQSVKDENNLESSKIEVTGKEESYSNSKETKSIIDETKTKIEGIQSGIDEIKTKASKNGLKKSQSLTGEALVSNLDNHSSELRRTNSELNKTYTVLQKIDDESEKSDQDDSRKSKSSKGKTSDGEKSVDIPHEENLKKSIGSPPDEDANGMNKTKIIENSSVSTENMVKLSDSPKKDGETNQKQVSSGVSVDQEQDNNDGAKVTRDSVPKLIVESQKSTSLESEGSSHGKDAKNELEKAENLANSVKNVDDVSSVATSLEMEPKLDDNASADVKLIGNLGVSLDQEQDNNDGAKVTMDSVPKLIVESQKSTSSGSEGSSHGKDAKNELEKAENPVNSVKNGVEVSAEPLKVIDDISTVATSLEIDPKLEDNNASADVKLIGNLAKGAQEAASTNSSKSEESSHGKGILNEVVKGETKDQTIGNAGKASDPAGIVEKIEERLAAKQPSSLQSELERNIDLTIGNKLSNDPKPEESAHVESVPNKTDEIKSEVEAANKGNEDAGEKASKMGDNIRNIEMTDKINSDDSKDDFSASSNMKGNDKDDHITTNVGDKTIGEDQKSVDSNYDMKVDPNIINDVNEKKKENEIEESANSDLVLSQINDSTAKTKESPGSIEENIEKKSVDDGEKSNKLEKGENKKIQKSESDQKDDDPEVDVKITPKLELNNSPIRLSDKSIALEESLKENGEKTLAKTEIRDDSRKLEERKETSQENKENYQADASMPTEEQNGPAKITLGQLEQDPLGNSSKTNQFKEPEKEVLEKYEIGNQKSDKNSQPFEEIPIKKSELGVNSENKKESEADSKEEKDENKKERVLESVEDFAKTIHKDAIDNKNEQVVGKSLSGEKIANLETIKPEQAKIEEDSPEKLKDIDDIQDAIANAQNIDSKENNTKTSVNSENIDESAKAGEDITDNNEKSAIAPKEIEENQSKMTLKKTKSIIKDLDAEGIDDEAKNGEMEKLASKEENSAIVEKSSEDITKIFEKNNLSVHEIVCGNPLPPDFDDEGLTIENVKEEIIKKEEAQAGVTSETAITALENNFDGVVDETKNLLGKLESTTKETIENSEQLGREMEKDANVIEDQLKTKIDDGKAGIIQTIDVGAKTIAENKDRLIEGIDESFEGLKSKIEGTQNNIEGEIAKTEQGIVEATKEKILKPLENNVDKVVMETRTLTENAEATINDSKEKAKKLIGDLKNDEIIIEENLKTKFDEAETDVAEIANGAANTIVDKKDQSIEEVKKALEGMQSTIVESQDKIKEEIIKKGEALTELAKENIIKPIESNADKAIEEANTVLENTESTIADSKEKCEKLVTNIAIQEIGIEDDIISKVKEEKAITKTLLDNKDETIEETNKSLEKIKSEIDNQVDSKEEITKNEDIQTEETNGTLLKSLENNFDKIITGTKTLFENAKNMFKDSKENGEELIGDAKTEVNKIETKIEDEKAKLIEAIEDSKKEGKELVENIKNGKIVIEDNIKTKIEDVKHDIIEAVDDKTKAVTDGKEELIEETNKSFEEIKNKIGETQEKMKDEILSVVALKDNGIDTPGEAEASFEETKVLPLSTTNTDVKDGDIETRIMTKSFLQLENQHYDSELSRIEAKNEVNLDSTKNSQENPAETSVEKRRITQNFLELEQKLYDTPSSLDILVIEETNPIEEEFFQKSSDSITQEIAALKIQSFWRKVRDNKHILLEKDGNQGFLTTGNLKNAAVIIQALFRGYLTRKMIKTNEFPSKKVDQQLPLVVEVSEEEDEDKKRDQKNIIELIEQIEAKEEEEINKIGEKLDNLTRSEEIGDEVKLSDEQIEKAIAKLDDLPIPNDLPEEKAKEDNVIIIYPYDVVSAVIKIQKVFRGFRDRKRIEAIRKSTNLKEETSDKTIADTSENRSSNSNESSKEKIKEVDAGEEDSKLNLQKDEMDSDNDAFGSEENTSSLVHTSEIHDYVVPNVSSELEKLTDEKEEQLKIDGEETGILHSSELHDSLIVPNKIEIEIESQIVPTSLTHSSELHDSIVVSSTEEIGNKQEDIVEKKKVELTEKSSPGELKKLGEKLEDQAARTIQRSLRRRQTQLNLLKQSQSVENDDESKKDLDKTYLIEERSRSVDETSANKSKQDEAARTIQKSFRRYQSRSNLLENDEGPNIDLLKKDDVKLGDLNRPQSIESAKSTDTVIFVEEKSEANESANIEIEECDDLEDHPINRVVFKNEKPIRKNDDHRVIGNSGYVTLGQQDLSGNSNRDEPVIDPDAKIEDILSVSLKENENPTAVYPDCFKEYIETVIRPSVDNSPGKQADSGESSKEGDSSKEEDSLGDSSKEKVSQDVPSKENVTESISSKADPSKEQVSQDVSSKEDATQSIPSKEEVPLGESSKGNVSSKEDVTQSVSSKEESVDLQKRESNKSSSKCDASVSTTESGMEWKHSQIVSEGDMAPIYISVATTRLGTTEDSQDNTFITNVEIRNGHSEGLSGSGEFHDSIPMVVTSPISNEDQPLSHEEPASLHSGEMHDTILPLAVQLSQTPGQVYVIITGSNEISSTRRTGRRKSSSRLVDANKNVQKFPQNDLEEKSATKIQAGIRGFLVRRRQKNNIKKANTKQ